MQVLIDNITSAVPNIKAGRIRPLSVTTLRRQSVLPDIPTLDESGLKDFEVLAWFSLFAPAATPKEIVGKLNAEISKVQSMPDVHEQMLSRGIEPRPMTPEQFAAVWRAEIQKFAQIVRARELRLSEKVENR